MLFNYVFGLQEVNKEKVSVNYREAVRAVIIQNNNILMVHCNKGDYKFPGGGVNTGESHEEALKREVREETGYIVSDVKKKIGVVIERNLDELKKETVFEMTSHYYLCEIFDEQTFQELDHYEVELDFKPEWIHIDKAIHLNEEVLKNKDKNKWVYREVNVLKALKDSII